MNRKQKARAKKAAVVVTKAVKTKGASLALGIAKKAAKRTIKGAKRTDRIATKAVRKFLKF
jgi:hypothetical protein